MSLHVVEGKIKLLKAMHVYCNGGWLVCLLFSRVGKILIVTASYDLNYNYYRSHTE